jgi:hypothetical protein
MVIGFALPGSQKSSCVGINDGTRRLKSNASVIPLRRESFCLTNFHMSNTVTVRLPTDLVQWLEEESRVTGLPKGRIVREQLEQLRTKKARQPFLDLAGSVESSPELSRKTGFEA